MEQNNLIKIQISQVVTNSDNYRKVIDKEKIFELSKSIKLNGLLHPLTVTDFEGFAPKDNEQTQYLLVSGFRRLAALKKAKVKSFFVNYRPELTEQQVQEIRLTENIQREDVEPMDEAEAFRDYLDANLALNEDDLSVRIGKSSSFVRKRLELLKLVAEWDKVVRKQKVPVSVALEVARCSVDHQHELYGVFVLNGVFNGHKKHIKKFIKENFDLQLSEAIFPKDKANFCGDDMPACKSCPFNTASEPLLFDDYKNNVCKNPTCYKGRTQGALRLKFEEYKKTVNDIGTPVVLFCKGFSLADVETEYLGGYANERIYLESQADIMTSPDDDCVLAYVMGSFDNDFKIGDTVYIKIRDSFRPSTDASNNGGNGENKDSTHNPEDDQTDDKDEFMASGAGVENDEKPPEPTEEELSAARCQNMIKEAEITNKPPNIDWQLLTITNLAYLLRDDDFFNNRVHDFCHFYIEMVEEVPGVWNKVWKRVWIEKLQSTIDDPGYTGYLLEKWDSRKTLYTSALQEMTNEEKVSFMSECAAQLSKKYLNLIEKEFNVQIVFKMQRTEPFMEALIGKL